MALPYDAHEIEARWQADWDARRLYQVDIDAVDPSAGPAFTNLVEFPYPSGEGLHVGHVFKYCGADAYGRYQRMRGRTVFQPIGFDSFGINAENYALRLGQHPATVVDRTTRRFRAQLSSIGIGWDWSRSVSTSDPSFYRWTQWVFGRLFDAGLAYRAEAPVTWCPSCRTVLANEQVQGGRCERCDTVVTTRNLRQWFLRITAYADRLKAGLAGLDWPDLAKRQQAEWIDGLHDWLISRQRYWGPPIPIVHCDRCGAVRVPDDQLPVLLPEVPVERVRPTGTAQSPLAAIDEWVRTMCPHCGGAARRETDV